VRHTDWELQRERLSASLDGELTAAERAALDAHLPGCDECQRELAALRQTRALLRALPAPALPRAFTLPETPAVVPLRRRHAPTWTRPVQALGSIAAMIGLGLLVATSLPHMSSQPSTGGGASTTSAPHTTDGATTAPSGVASPTGKAGSVTLTPPPVTPTAGAPGYSTIHAPSVGQAQPAQPFPIIPVSGVTLLVGGAAAVTAGGLARRRARRGEPPETEPESEDEPAS
jgi:anti-sigma factor RsiW